MLQVEFLPLTIFTGLLCFLKAKANFWSDILIKGIFCDETSSFSTLKVLDGLSDFDLVFRGG